MKQRLDDLNELETCLPGLIEAEDTARAASSKKEREVQKLHKQKKQKAKLLWDTRIQVARDYTGDADTDLNLYLTLPDLEKAFAKSNPAYADAFQSAMKRTSETMFHIMIGKILESEDVTLEVLETEVRAIQTYMGDVRQWEREDWSPDTNWILPLIAAKKAKAETSSDGVSVAPAKDTVDSLWEQITPAIAAWKSERKGQGIGHASKTMFISATKRFHDLPQERETDVDLLQKLLALVTAIQGRMYTFERYVKMQCNGASIWRTDETADVPASDSSENRADESESLSSGNGVESRRLQASQHPRFSAEEQTLTESESTPTSEPEKPDWEQKQREHVNRLESLPGEIRQLLPTWQQAHGIEGTLTLKLLLNARKHIEFGRERGPDPFFREEMEDLLQRMKSNDEGFVKKVRELLRGAEPAQEQSNSVAQYEQTLTLIEKLKDGLKKVHVVDIEEFVDDILHFYNGVGVSDLATRPEETLKNITDFIEGFVDEPLQAWPEYIRDSHHIPKRELVLVSIGISNNTDDEFELVEFTDESSDEIRCDLNALPEDLRTALLKLASEQIYAEAVKEFDTDDS